LLWRFDGAQYGVVLFVVVLMDDCNGKQDQMNMDYMSMWSTDDTLLKKLPRGQTTPISVNTKDMSPPRGS